MDRNTERKAYAAPSIEDFGAVTDLTATGLTQPGTDTKGGSAASEGA
jgi:hypothetical protein